MPAKETAKMFGIPRFEGGFGDWFGKALNYASSKIGNLADMIDDKLDAVEDVLKDPLGTLVKIYTHGTNTAKVMWHDIADNGARDKIPHYAEQWFTNLLKKAEDKLESIESGPLSGDHKALMRRAGIPASWFSAIDYIVSHESGWRVNATNPSSGAYGLPQSWPGSKMASAGADWRTNPITQLKWMKNYVTERYGGGPQAAAYWRAHHNYANGGWADKLSIFGEVPGEPEVAINPARDTSEGHIAEAIEARAKINPNGFAGTLSKLIESAKNSANNLVPVINQGTNQVRTASSVASRSAKIDGNLNVVMNVDGKTIGHVTYATWRAIRSHEVNIQAKGGAIPVGGAQPLGGVY